MLLLLLLCFCCCCCCCCCYAFVVVVVVMLLMLFDNILRGSQWLSSHRPVQWQVPLDCCPSFGIDMTANSLIAENKPETDVIGEWGDPLETVAVTSGPDQATAGPWARSRCWAPPPHPPSLCPPSFHSQRCSNGGHVTPIVNKALLKWCICNCIITFWKWVMKW